MISASEKGKGIQSEVSCRCQVLIVIKKLPKINCPISPMVRFLFSWLFIKAYPVHNAGQVKHIVSWCLMCFKFYEHFFQVSYYIFLGMSSQKKKINIDYKTSQYKKVATYITRCCSAKSFWKNTVVKTSIWSN